MNHTIDIATIYSMVSTNSVAKCKKEKLIEEQIIIRLKEIEMLIIKMTEVKNEIKHLY